MSSPHRHVRRRIAAMLTAFAFGTILVSSPALAQGTSGEVIPGSECVTPARPVTFLGALVATPIASEEYQAPTGIPQGNAPDEATVAEIESVVRQFIACSNSGDVLRALTLFDDDYLRRAIDPTGELDSATANELVKSFATPIALDDEQLVVFIAVREIVELPDGTIAVVLETDGGLPDPEGTDVDLFIFAHSGDGWIIIDAVNDIDDIEEQSTPGAGS